MRALSRVVLPAAYPKGASFAGFPVSPLTPATFLIVGLTGVELGDHQKFTTPFLFGASVLMTAACLIFGVFPM